MKNNYDVVVVGAGPAGIMACYELYLKQPVQSSGTMNRAVFLPVRLQPDLAVPVPILTVNSILPVNLAAG